MTPLRSYRNPDGTTETWWTQDSREYRGVQIETILKTLQRENGVVIAEDVALLITDHTTPRRIGIPLAVLDEVITALQQARTQAHGMHDRL